MPQPAQTFENHVRREPVFLFSVAVLFLHFAHVVARLVRDFTLDNFEAVLLAVALFFVAVLTRVNAIKPQDRIIQLEEQLRYQRVLSPALLARTSALKPGQITALRFASDAELPGLVEQTLAGQFAKPVDIKKAIRSWRADHYARV